MERPEGRTVLEAQIKNDNSSEYAVRNPHTNNLCGYITGDVTARQYEKLGFLTEQLSPKLPMPPFEINASQKLYEVGIILKADSEGLIFPATLFEGGEEKHNTLISSLSNNPLLTSSINITEFFTHYNDSKDIYGIFCCMIGDLSITKQDQLYSYLGYIITDTVEDAKNMFIKHLEALATSMEDQKRILDAIQNSKKQGGVLVYA